MDFRHIRAFIAVADALSVTRAAERLHITQPPLTRHIHQLERELGVTLFVRHRHGVSLTSSGQLLLDRARSLDAAAADFLFLARHSVSPDTGTVRVGIAWGLWDLVHKVRVEFAKQHPHVTIDATDACGAMRPDEQLKNRSLDVVFGRPPFDAGLDVSEPILYEPIQAVIGDESPLARLASLRIRDLAGVPLLLWDRPIAPVLYDRMLALYARAELDVPMIATPGAGPYNHAGLMLVASGKGVYLGYGVSPISPQAPSGVAVRPVSDEGATMEVCVVSRRHESSAIVARFIEAVWRVYPRERRVRRQRSEVA
jgi:DNA-binding transcriptional LysR family regulator